VRDFVETVRDRPVDDHEAAELDAACSACRGDGVAVPGPTAHTGADPGADTA
jgi:hypothetical protein